MDRKDQIKALLVDAPGDSFLRFALAKEYEKGGEDAGAVGMYESIGTDDPNYVGTYYHWGKALERLARPAAAWRVYSKGIEIAGKLGEDHARRELLGARFELGDEEDFV